MGRLSTLPPTIECKISNHSDHYEREKHRGHGDPAQHDPFGHAGMEGRTKAYRISRAHHDLGHTAEGSRRFLRVVGGYSHSPMRGDSGQRVVRVARADADRRPVVLDLEGAQG
jgi:hypothetical protein